MTLSQKISIVLLAGGKGTRMKSSSPKQFLNVLGKPLALYSFEIFLAHPQVDEIVVVCSTEHQSLFDSKLKTIRFALPGKRRQDSVYNGLEQVKKKEGLVCVHDAARPCISMKILDDLFKAGCKHDAATLGVPLSSTLKKVDQSGQVIETVSRDQIWEIQTPQIALKSLLEKGFAIAHEKNLDVTDDTSLVELIPYPVQVVASDPTNIKLTRPEDLILVEAFLKMKEEEICNASIA